MPSCPVLPRSFYVFLCNKCSRSVVSILVVELIPTSSSLAPFSHSPRAILPLESVEMHHDAAEEEVAGDNVDFNAKNVSVKEFVP
jgi:hypothetical protein